MADTGRSAVTRIPGFTAAALLTFVLLYVPIATLVVYSFNAAPSMSRWDGFSLQWYEAALQNRQVREVALRSLWLALAAGTMATLVATLAALATVRGGRFRGRTMIHALINQPLMVPEIVTGVALMVVFSVVRVRTGYDGMAYLVLAHTAFCIPFAYLPVRARLETLDPTLAHAAADLYASRVRAFLHVTLPLLWPGVLAGFMLAFVISLDAVVITEFVKSAGQDTLPTWMLGQLRRVVTPEMNVVATLLLGVSMLAVTAFFLLSRRRG